MRHWAGPRGALHNAPDTGAAAAAHWKRNARFTQCVACARGAKRSCVCAVGWQGLRLGTARRKQRPWASWGRRDPLSAMAQAMAGPRQIVTKVQGQCGWRVFGLDAAVDEPGIYAMWFDQSKPHGNEAREAVLEDALPVLRGSPQTPGASGLDDAQLVQHCQRSLRDHSAVAACLRASPADRTSFLALWEEDLRDLAPGGIALGLPNSRAAGLFRGQGIAHGRFASALKALPEARRLGLTAQWVWSHATGGAPPPTMPSLDNLCTSFDAVAWTDNAHKYVGLASHTDATTADPAANLQGLIIVWPPPDNARRLGVFTVYYPATLPAWRAMAQSLLCRWGSCPNLLLRWTPWPNFGSKDRPAQGWRVIGGLPLTKTAAEALTDEELEGAVATLPAWMQALLPPPAGPLDIDMPAFLQRCGYRAMPLSEVQQQLRNASDSDRRRLLLCALAGGLRPNGRTARGHFAVNMLRGVTAVVEGGIALSCPRKVHEWAKAGGRKRRPKSIALKPTGRIGKKLSLRCPSLQWLGHGPSHCR